MKNKTIIFTTLLFASSAAFAESSLFEAAGKELVKDKATAVLPDAVKNLGAASEAVDTAKTVKSPAAAVAPKAEAAKPKTADVAPKAEAATPKAIDAAPVEAATPKAADVAPKAAEATPAPATSATKDAVKETAADKAPEAAPAVPAVPSTPDAAIEAVKSKVTEKATGKALNMLK